MKNFIKKSSLNILLFFTLSSHVYASTFDFGGACESSKGDWTKKAMLQTKNIASALNLLKDDENCKGIVNLLTSARQQNLSIIGASQKNYLDLGTKNKDNEARPAELKALSKVLSQDNLKPRDFQLLQDKIFSSVFKEAAEVYEEFSPLTKLTNSAETGLILLENVMGHLPAYTQCLDAHPNEALSIVSATLSVANSYLSSGYGYLSRVGNSLEQFIVFLRDYKFARALREVSEPQYWASVSCLMETTAEAYCNASNGLQMLEISKQKEKEKKLIAEAHPDEKLLDGYYIWRDDVVNISNWLSKVLSA